MDIEKIHRENLAMLRMRYYCTLSWSGRIDAAVSSLIIFSHTHFISLASFTICRYD